MGKIRLFKESANKICHGLTKEQGCMLIQDIRETQKKLHKTESAMVELDVCKIDMTEISEFLFANAMNVFRYKASLLENTCEKLEAKYIIRDLTDVKNIPCSFSTINNLDKLIADMTAVLSQMHLFAQKQAEASELRNKITKAKEVLGIE